MLPALVPTRRRRRIGFTVAGALSLLLHAGSLYAFLAWPGRSETGALAQPSDAISVEIVANRTLEAMQPRQSVRAGAVTRGDRTDRGQDGSVERRPRAATAERGARARDQVPQPPVVIPDATEEVMRSVRQETPAVSEAPPLPVDGPAEVAPPPPKSGVSEDNAPAKRKEQKQPRKKKAAEPAPKGGVVSKSAPARARVASGPRPAAARS